MKIFLSSILCIFVFSSCDALTGDTGAQGEPGPPGPQGPTGALGIEVVQFTLNAANFSVLSEGVEGYGRDIPELTQSIVDEGLVLAYIDIDGWSALPLVLPTDVATASLTFAYDVGQLAIFIFNDAGASLASVYDGLRVKFVLVPPAAVGTVSAANLSDLDAVLQFSEESQ